MMNIENPMVRPLKEKIVNYTVVRLKVTCERDIIIYNNDDFDDIVNDQFDDMATDPSNFTYDWDYIDSDYYIDIR